MKAKALCVFSLLSAVVFLLLSSCKTTKIDAPRTEVPDDFHDAVSGTFDGHTVTMSYSGYCADIDWPNDPKQFYKFEQGHTPVLRYSGGFYFINQYGGLLGIYQSCNSFEDGKALVQTMEGDWVYIDMSGRVLGPAAPPESSPTVSNPYRQYAGNGIYFYPSDTNTGLYALGDENGNRITESVYLRTGKAVDGMICTRLAEGEHKNILIDLTGKTVTDLPDEGRPYLVDTGYGGIVINYSENDKSDSFVQLLNTNGVLLNERHFDNIGDFCYGLAPIFLDGKVGLIDYSGTVVIEPVFPYDTDVDLYTFMNEDLLLVPTNGKVAVIQISRS